MNSTNGQMASPAPEAAGHKWRRHAPLFASPLLRKPVTQQTRAKPMLLGQRRRRGANI